MKPTDVTNEMVADTCEAVGSFAWDGINRSEIIAAAVNAIFSDPTPITAERLVARGWSKGFKSIFHLKNGSAFNVSWESGLITISTQFLAFSFPCKTIGQLRALEIGLGITP